LSLTFVKPGTGSELAKATLLEKVVSFLGFKGFQRLLSFNVRRPNTQSLWPRN